MTNPTPLPSHDWITTTRVDDRLHLEVHRSSLGESDGKSIKAHIDVILDHPAHQQSVLFVVLELEHVELITSSVLGSMIVTHKNLASTRRRLVLTKLTTELEASFGFLKLDDEVFTICQTEKALNQLTQVD